MNFLAHIYLSGDQEEVLVGNFAGDFIKGKSYRHFPEDLQKGVLLHREIDRFTDGHEVVLKSKERLRPTYHHYAPVIADVFYDHFLADQWSTYHHEDLESFTLTFYEKITKYLTIIPAPAARMFTYMRKDNWLYHYKYIDGVHQALSGMSIRTPYNSKMEHASKDLKKDYQHYREEFDHFFPDLIQHAHSYLNSLT